MSIDILKNALNIFILLLLIHYIVLFICYLFIVIESTIMETDDSEIHKLPADYVETAFY